MKWMKKNSQGTKEFKLLPREQLCSQKKQGLSCLEEQPCSKDRKIFFLPKDMIVPQKNKI
jgi:hypothetical protein